jgi:hypothetical protein
MNLRWKLNSWGSISTDMVVVDDLTLLLEKWQIEAQGAQFDMCSLEMITRCKE